MRSISHALAMGGQSIHPCPRHLPKHGTTTCNVLFAFINGRLAQQLLVVCAPDARCSHPFAHPAAAALPLLSSPWLSVTALSSNKPPPNQRVRAPALPSLHFATWNQGAVAARMNASTHQHSLPTKPAFDCLHSAAINSSQSSQISCASSSSLPPAAPWLHPSSADNPLTAGHFIELQPRLLSCPPGVWPISHKLYY